MSARKAAICSGATRASGQACSQVRVRPSTWASSRRASRSALSLLPSCCLPSRNSAATGAASAGPAIVSACQFGELVGLVFGQQGVDEVVQFTVHDGAQLVQRKLDAMVGHAAIRPVVGAN